MKTIKKANKMLKKYNEFSIDEKINIKSYYKQEFINNSLHYDFCFNYDFNYAYCKSGSSYKMYRETRDPNHPAIKAKRKRMARKAWKRKFKKKILTALVDVLIIFVNVFKVNLFKNDPNRIVRGLFAYYFFRF